MTRASLNSTVSLNSTMSSTQFVNGTMLTVLSTKGANLGAITVSASYYLSALYQVFYSPQPFGAYLNAVLCPPKGCYTPNGIDLLTKSFWSDPTSWIGGQVPTANQDVSKSLMSTPCLNVILLWEYLGDCERYSMDSNGHRSAAAGMHKDLRETDLPSEFECNYRCYVHRGNLPCE